MSLEQTVIDIVTRLRQGRFANEQSISQGIVLRILQELGWDTWDTTLVWPEYQTGEGRADFALCHPASKPAVLIEVKQPGKAEDAVRQSLEYSFHTGVPFVVLTDGRTWSFYLPAEQGSYDDRRVYKLDLFEREPTEAAESFTRYLARAHVESGAALDAARREYRSRNRRDLARTAIPDAWRELVDKGDETLVEILANAVESKAGVRPEEDDVADFLARLGRATTPSPPQSPSRTARPVNVSLGTTHVFNGPTPSARRGVLVLLGRSHNYGNAKDAMVTVLAELANRDSTFLERCAQHPEMQGRKRRYIARRPEDLYPDRPDLQDYRESLPGGWYVATNLNNILKKDIIKTATQVAGLHFGTDVAIEF